jgi:hypothetical protein
MDSGGNPTGKLTLALTPTGDIDLVQQRSKLAEQLIRAIVNDSAVASGFELNSATFSPKYINLFVNNILRQFRQTQIDSTNRVDTSLLGYSIVRAGGIAPTPGFYPITSATVRSTYTDTGLTNGLSYTYGIKKVYSTFIESAIIEQITATPSQFSKNQNHVIGQYFTVFQGNGQVTLYIDYNHTFSKAELLEKIEDITINVDPQEPRKYFVNVVVKDLYGNKVSLSSNRFSIT